MNLPSPVTRQTLAVMARRLCLDARRDISPGFARVRVGHNGAFYGQTGVELEGWSRPLWAVAPLIAGGGDFPGLEDLVEGLDHGTDPDHPEFWGWPGDGDPRLVEMAGIAQAIRLIPNVIWAPLSDAAKSRAAAWLLRINGVSVFDCNWLFFRVLVNHALGSVGAPHDPAQAARDLDRIEEMSLGGGWYADGPGGACDHYNGFAFHFYGLLYSFWAGDKDPQRAWRFRERASAFAADFIHWFDIDGACVPYGRSLTYRFAMAAFWAAAAYAGLPVFNPGILRGILMRHLRWWMSQPVLDAAGRITLGYAYPNLNMTEIYNSPASPAWALKSFLVLALPESDAFWQAPEEPLPALEQPRIMANGRLLAQRIGNGHAILLSAGQNWKWDGRNYAAKYARFAYSSRWSFSVPLGDSPLEAACTDSALLVSTDGIHWSGRGETAEHDFGTDWVESSWSPCEGVRIRTRLAARPDGHERIHEIKNTREIHVVEGAFALPRGPEPLATLGLNPAPGIHGTIKPGFARWEIGGTFCGIEDLPQSGFALRSARLVENWPNTNLQHPSTVTPILESKLQPGFHTLRCRICHEPR